MKKFKTIVAVDLSMSSPGIAILKLEDEYCLENVKFHFFTDRKKLLQNFEMDKKFEAHEMPKIKSYEKYDFLSSSIMGIIEQYEDVFVVLEGYSMSSMSGMFLNIAENGGIFRWHLYKSGIDFIIPAPSHVKKVFSGNGKSDKTAMHEAFKERTGTDLEMLLLERNYKNTPSPVSDLVDAYALIETGLVNLKLLVK